jgi:hypothetical protein
LIGHILKNNNDTKINSAASDDGSYDNKENFKYLQKKKIRIAAIKVRNNSIISSKNKNNRPKNKEKFILR